MISVVTCATQNNTGLVNFKNSFSSFSGWNVQVIGLGKKWNGYKTRINLYIDYLKTQNNPDQITILIDCYDVLCVSDSHEFKKKFESYGSSLIVGSEKVCSMNCRPPLKFNKFHQQKKNYPNGGFIVGKVKDLLFLWEWVLEQGLMKDDQIAVSHFMDEFPEKVSLDTLHLLVYNDNNGKSADIEIQKGKIIVNNQYNPYFIHFPGLKNKQSRCWSKISEYPQNYIFVGKCVCKEQFIKEMSVRVIEFYVSLFFLIFIGILVIGLIIFFLSRGKKIKTKKGVFR